MRRLAERLPQAIEFVWYVLERYIPIAVQAVVSILVIRYFGPALFGFYALAVTTAQVMTTIGGWALDDRIYVRLSDREADAQEELSRALGVRLATGGLASLILTGILLFQFRDRLHDGFLLLGLLPLIESFTIGLAYFRARGPMRVAAMITAATAFCSAAMRLLAVLTGQAMLVFVGILVVEKLLSIGFLAAALKRFGVTLKPALDSKAVVADVRSGASLAAGGMANVLYLYIDNFIVFALAGPKALGIYAAATRLIQIAYPIVTAMAAMQFARATKRFGGAGEEARSSVNKAVASYVLPFSLALSIGSIAVTPYLATLLLGEEYSHAGDVIRILGLNIFWVGVGIANHYALIAANLNRVVLYRNVAGVVVCAVVCPILLGLYGPAGAAAASVTAFFSVSVLFLLFFGGESRRLLLDQFLFWRRGGVA